jgi:hypothetical protein
VCHARQRSAAIDTPLWGDRLPGVSPGAPPASRPARAIRFGLVSVWHPSIANGRQTSVRSPRRCTRNGCPKLAVATLTYVYADSTAVIGPLAAFAEPHSYDLCERHARGLTAPRGWELVRHEGEFEPPPPGPDDLVALAEAVREAARPAPRREEPAVRMPGRPPTHLGRRGHLRVIPPPAAH